MSVIELVLVWFFIYVIENVYFSSFGMPNIIPIIIIITSSNIPISSGNFPSY